MRFDEGLDAWVVADYAGVSAALREPRLSASGARGGARLDRASHSAFRAKASADAARMMAQWGPLLEPYAREMVESLPLEGVDLVREFAGPWSLKVAAELICPGGDARRMNGLAEKIFEAAAEPFDESLRHSAEQATLALAAMVPGELAGFHVQAFVALSQTLPCFLGSAWLALLNDPECWLALRDEPELMPAAIDELLRHSGPSRALLRCAVDELTLGGAVIAQGDRVVLMVADANRDPAVFTEPERLDFRRSSPRHLGLGDGMHACIGASLIRTAAAAATSVFLKRFAGARIEGAVTWTGGFAIAGPAALRVSGWRSQSCPPQRSHPS
jgi:cytochrome P450